MQELTQAKITEMIRYGHYVLYKGSPWVEMVRNAIADVTYGHGNYIDISEEDINRIVEDMRGTEYYLLHLINGKEILFERKEEDAPLYVVGVDPYLVENYKINLVESNI